VITLAFQANSTQWIGVFRFVDRQVASIKLLTSGTSRTFYRDQILVFKTPS
jgi:hypothetical protein